LDGQSVLPIAGAAIRNETADEKLWLTNSMMEKDLVK
jgi:hypothetical protein